MLYQVAGILICTQLYAKYATLTFFAHISNIYIYIQTMSRKTAQLFDLMFKSIIKDASSSAVVHLINGIYKKNYPLDTKVTIEPNELIKEHPKSGKMEKIVYDIIITLHTKDKKDTFLLEAQISDDLEMILRIFNYSTLSCRVGEYGFASAILHFENPQGVGEKRY